MKAAREAAEEWKVRWKKIGSVMPKTRGAGMWNYSQLQASGTVVHKIRGISCKLVGSQIIKKRTLATISVRPGVRAVMTDSNKRHSADSTKPVPLGDGTSGDGKGTAGRERG